MQLDEYRKLAEVEDHMWYFSALNRRMMFPLRDLVGHPASILDAGCGTGGLINFLRTQNPQWVITGLDFSPTACMYSRDRTGSRILEGSITDLPFPDNTFDAVLCADVISQVPNGLQAMKEFARVVRPGGIVVVNVAAYQWMWSYHDNTCHTQHRYRKSELKRIAVEAGLVPRFSSYANMLIFPMIVARRKLFPPADSTSDVRRYPPLLELICSKLADLEYGFMRAGMVMPLGSSVFLAATR